MNSVFTEENLLAFTTTARHGSFSKAAEEPGLTTSAISYTVKRLESGLDVTLFIRNTPQYCPDGVRFLFLAQGHRFVE